MYIHTYVVLVYLRNKSRRSRRSGEMGFLGAANAPFQITYVHMYMSLDTVGGFVGNHSTAKYLHILVDHFSRYAYVYLYFVF